MADVHSKEIRSYNMSRIRGRDTKPEILVRRGLFSRGFRFRIHEKKLPGRPDVILKKYRTVIFVHGCFWHGHEGCRYFSIPKTRTEWWTKKFRTNKQNDHKVVEQLALLDWKVITVWECELKPSNIDKSIRSIIERLTGNA